MADPAFPHPRPTDRYTRAGWKHLRTLQAAPTGTFAADTDWAGTAPETALATTLTAPIPKTRALSGAETTRLRVMVFALNTSGGMVARAAMTFDVQVVEQIGRPDTDGPGVVIMDSAVTAAMTLNRTFPIATAAEAQAFTIRLSNFAGTPATADQLIVLYRED